jgi:hypothetical protein
MLNPLKALRAAFSGDDSSDGEELRSFQATICFSIVKVRCHAERRDDAGVLLLHGPLLSM